MRLLASVKSTDASKLQWRANSENVGILTQSALLPDHFQPFLLAIQDAEHRTAIK